MVELKLPELGENIETAEVSRVLIAEGDAVKVDQNVLELESDKASFPLPSTHAGRVARIRVKAGDTVSVGQTLMEIEEAAAKEAAGKRDVEKKPVLMAKAENANSKKEPEKKSKHEELIKAEEPSAERPSAEEADVEEADVDEPKQPGPAFVAAGPATRTLARELGVRIEDVQGHGPRGRITREDVKAFVQNRLTEEGKPKESVQERKNEDGRDAQVRLADFSQWGPISRQRLSPLARTTAERLRLAWREVPHVTQHDEADVTELEKARKHYNEANRGSRPKITPTALAICAAVAALKAFPRFNSSLNADATELILKNYYHIAVAVDTEQGLLVPVVRDADRKSLVEIAAAVAQLAEKARDRSLTKKDMEGSTFTISNLGGIGGTSFTPIVNFPEVAILGMSRARWQLVPADAKTEQRLLLPLSLSYDHRVINGADGARFLAMVASLLSDPFQLLAEA